MARFYGHFAAAYGTFWFCLMVAAVLSQSHINAGAFGLWGFPIIAFFYALIRMSVDSSELSEIHYLREHVRRLEMELEDRDLD